MEKKYINESRYKKEALKKRRNSKTVKSNLKSKNKQEPQNKKRPKNSEKVNSRVNVAKKKPSKIKKQTRTVNIILCVIILVIIAIVSRAILKEDNESFIPFDFFQEKNDAVVKIGIITNDDLLNNNTNNIVINELYRYSRDTLLAINEDYSITYKCLSGVTKISNKEYILVRNEESNVTVHDIKSSLDSYRNNKDSVYYENLASVDSITVIDKNKLRVKLKTESPYFIYHLAISLNSSKDRTNYEQDSSSNSKKLIFNRSEHADRQLPNQIIVFKYKDVYEAVKAYKNKDIDIFLTNSKNVVDILGKHEYNLKTWKNGETMFLLLNPQSEICSKQEARKAVAYSIDRDSIIRDILKSKGEKIDLPYIYDVVKYKYDIYAAENLLLTNGYKKTNKVYSITQGGKRTTLEFDLIVNKSDSVKVNIANNIKKNLDAIGLKINVEKINEKQIETRIKNGNYDLILANIDLNNIPDISFVEKNLFITDEVAKAIEQVNNSTILELPKNLKVLQNCLSQDVSIIGLYSDVSYLIYRGNSITTNDVTYMNLFDGMLN